MNKTPQSIKLLSQLNESLSCFVSGKNPLVGMHEERIVRPQNGDIVANFRSETLGEVGAGQDKVLDRNNTTKVEKEIANVVAGVEN